MSDPPEMQELARITARLAEIEPERDQLRERAAVLALTLLQKKVEPGAVADRSPFSASHLRKMARAAGIEPAPRGNKARKIVLPAASNLTS